MFEHKDFFFVSHIQELDKSENNKQVAVEKSLKGR